MLQALGTSSYPLHDTCLTQPSAAPQGSSTHLDLFVSDVGCVKINKLNLELGRPLEGPLIHSLSITPNRKTSITRNRTPQLLTPTGGRQSLQQEDVRYQPQQEETYLALPNRKCYYFTSPERRRKTSVLPSNKPSQWKMPQLSQ